MPRRHTQLVPQVRCPIHGCAMYYIRAMRKGTQYGCPRGHLYTVPLDGISNEQFACNLERSIDSLCRGEQAA